MQFFIGILKFLINSVFVPLHFRDEVFEVLALLGDELLVGDLEFSDLLLVVVLLEDHVLQHILVVLIIPVERRHQLLNFLLVYRLSHLDLFYVVFV